MNKYFLLFAPLLLLFACTPSKSSHDASDTDLLGITCERDGVTYQIGDIIQIDHCNYCECDESGDFLCTKTNCDDEDAIGEDDEILPDNDTAKPDTMTDTDPLLTDHDSLLTDPDTTQPDDAVDIEQPDLSDTEGPDLDTAEPDTTPDDLYELDPIDEDLTPDDTGDIDSPLTDHDSLLTDPDTDPLLTDHDSLLTDPDTDSLLTEDDSLLTDSDTNDCTNTDTRTLVDVCGFNGKGDQPQLCTAGFWENDGLCVDPDECLNTDTRDAPCGFNGNGTIPQLCIAGGWVDNGLCLDPDVCMNTDTKTLVDICGLNGKGDQPQVCTGGQWVNDGSCVDPDVCLTDALRNNIYSCGTDNQGYQPQKCVEGAWANEGACVFVACPNYIDLTDAPDRSLNTIASFNMLRLGDNNGKDFLALACLIRTFTITSILELRNLTGVQTLHDQLEALTGESWEYHISEHSVGRSTYKEYYGYLWRSEKASLETVYDFYPETADEFEREPYGAQFKIGDMDLTLVALHAIYGDTLAERRSEALQLINVYTYFQGLSTSDNDVIIAGDFNLPYDATYFTLTGTDNIINTITPTTLTTIGDTGLVSSYDNMFYSQTYTTEYVSSGVMDYTMDNYSTLNSTVSDHIPVFMVLNTAGDDD